MTLIAHNNSTTTPVDDMHAALRMYIARRRVSVEYVLNTDTKDDA